MEQYELRVGDEYYDEENILRTSLVDNPATRKLFAVFSDEGKVESANQKFQIILPTRPNQQKLSRTDKFERIISGVWFMPDTDYPRMIKNDSGEDQMITASMSKDELMTTVKNFVQSGNMNQFDIMHNGLMVEGLRTIEIWMLYDHSQLSPVLLNSIWDLGYTVDDIPLGTVFMSVFIENEQFFNEMILSGKVKGFSIEGLFNLHLKQEEIMEDIIERFDSKSSQMFNCLGLYQEEGTLITDKGNLTFSKEGLVTLDDIEITDGSFKLANKFSIEVRENKIVDFGFEEVEAVSVDNTVDNTETSTTVTDNVNEDNGDVIDVEEKQEQQLDIEVSDENNNSANDDVVTDDKDKVSVNEDDKLTIDVKTVLADKDAQIEDLKAQLAAETLAKEEVLKSLPIPKSNAQNNIQYNTENYTKKIVGGKTHYIPKI